VAWGVPELVVYILTQGVERDSDDNVTDDCSDSSSLDLNIDMLYKAVSRNCNSRIHVEILSTSFR